MNLDIKSIEFHRNGISGVGFHAVLFSAEGYDGTFLATVFPEDGFCSVVNLDRIPKHGVNFFENSWRGDHFEGDLRRAIYEHDQLLRQQIGRGIRQQQIAE